jgi:hypothetical protein
VTRINRPHFGRVNGVREPATRAQAVYASLQAPAEQAEQPAGDRADRPDGDPAAGGHGVNRGHQGAGPAEVKEIQVGQVQDHLIGLAVQGTDHAVHLGREPGGREHVQIAGDRDDAVSAIQGGRDRQGLLVHRSPVSRQAYLADTWPLLPEAE